MAVCGSKLGQTTTPPSASQNELHAIVWFLVTQDTRRLARLFVRQAAFRYYHPAHTAFRLEGGIDEIEQTPQCRSES